ncbi:MAG: hypothetical protein IPJ65_07790 [Archangiaceae bacterium]|nr:hypothetical protein [Archangiaceae bacterium]
MSARASRRTAPAAVTPPAAKPAPAKITVKDSTAHIDGLEYRAYDVLVDSVGKQNAKRLGLSQSAPVLDLFNLLDRLARRPMEQMTDHTMQIPVRTDRPVVRNGELVEFPLSKPVSDAAVKFLGDWPGGGTPTLGSVSDESVDIKPNGEAVLSVPAKMVVNWGPFEK